MKFWSKCHSFLFFFIKSPLLSTWPEEIPCRSKSNIIQSPVTRLKVTERHSKLDSSKQCSMQFTREVAGLFFLIRSSFNLNPMTLSNVQLRPLQLDFALCPVFVIVVKQRRWEKSRKTKGKKKQGKKWKDTEEKKVWWETSGIMMMTKVCKCVTQDTRHKKQDFFRLSVCLCVCLSSHLFAVVVVNL